MKRPIIGLAPFCTNNIRRDWPLPRWIELAKALEGQGMTVLVFHTWFSAVADVPGRKVIGVPIWQLGALVAECDAVVTPDSGLFHLSAAVHVPAIGLFGSTHADQIAKHYPLHKTHLAEGRAARPQVQAALHDVRVARLRQPVPNTGLRNSPEDYGRRSSGGSKGLTLETKLFFDPTYIRSRAGFFAGFGPAGSNHAEKLSLTQRNDSRRAPGRGRAAPGPGHSAPAGTPGKASRNLRRLDLIPGVKMRLSVPPKGEPHDDEEHSGAGF